MKKGVIGVIVAVVALAAIAGAVVLVNKHNNSKPRNDTTSNTTTNSNGSDMSNMHNSNNSGNNAVATNSVSIKDFAFSPANITVKKGTTVTWTNNDSAQHTVTGDTDGGPHSQPLGKGDSYTFTFDTAGTFTYHCSFHSSMTGKVVVTE